MATSPIHRHRASSQLNAPLKNEQTEVQSLIRELRSPKPCSVAGKKENKHLNKNHQIFEDSVSYERQRPEQITGKK